MDEVIVRLVRALFIFVGVSVSRLIGEAPVEVRSTLLMSKLNNPDRRVDSYTSARVDEALRMRGKSGISAALEFMQLVGVPRGIAWRILCSPIHCRKQEQRNASRSDALDSQSAS